MLLVERKELDIDGARAFVNDGRLPEYTAIKMQRCFGHQCHLVITIGALNYKQKVKFVAEIL
jgi:hypothetical protein